MKSLHKIVGAFIRQLEIPKCSRLVPLAEIEANDDNPPRYLDGTESGDLQDIDAHLWGGIPDRDADDLSRYRQVLPGLRTALFAPADRPGCRLCPARQSAGRGPLPDRGVLLGARVKRAEGSLLEVRLDGGIPVALRVVGRPLLRYPFSTIESRVLQ